MKNDDIHRRSTLHNVAAFLVVSKHQHVLLSYSTATVTDYDSIIDELTKYSNTQQPRMKSSHVKKFHNSYDITRSYGSVRVL